MPTPKRQGPGTNPVNTAITVLVTVILAGLLLAALAPAITQLLDALTLPCS